MWLPFAGVRGVTAAGQTGTRRFIMNAASGSAASCSCRSLWVHKMLQGGLFHFWLCVSALRPLLKMVTWSTLLGQWRACRWRCGMYKLPQKYFTCLPTWKEWDQLVILTFFCNFPHVDVMSWSFPSSGLWARSQWNVNLSMSTVCIRIWHPGFHDNDYWFVSNINDTWMNERWNKSHDYSSSYCKQV